MLTSNTTTRKLAPAITLLLLLPACYAPPSLPLRPEARENLKWLTTLHSTSLAALKPLPPDRRAEARPTLRPWFLEGPSHPRDTALLYAEDLKDDAAQLVAPPEMLTPSVRVYEPDACLREAVTNLDRADTMQRECIAYANELRHLLVIVSYNLVPPGSHGAGGWSPGRHEAEALLFNLGDKIPRARFAIPAQSSEAARSLESADALRADLRTRHWLALDAGIDQYLPGAVGPPPPNADY